MSASAYPISSSLTSFAPPSAPRLGSVARFPSPPASPYLSSNSAEELTKPALWLSRRPIRPRHHARRQPTPGPSMMTRTATAPGALVGLGISGVSFPRRESPQYREQRQLSENHRLDIVTEEEEGGWAWAEADEITEVPHLRHTLSESGAEDEARYVQPAPCAPLLPSQPFPRRSHALLLSRLSSGTEVGATSKGRRLVGLGISGIACANSNNLGPLEGQAPLEGAQRSSVNEWPSPRAPLLPSQPFPRRPYARRLMSEEGMGATIKGSSPVGLGISGVACVNSTRLSPLAEQSPPASPTHASASLGMWDTSPPSMAGLSTIYRGPTTIGLGFSNISPCTDDLVDDSSFSSTSSGSADVSDISTVSFDDI